MLWNMIFFNVNKFGWLRRYGGGNLFWLLIIRGDISNGEVYPWSIVPSLRIPGHKDPGHAQDATISCRVLRCKAGLQGEGILPN
ncbi:hypothetical protein MTP99_015024 [Tenebrio molitor]|nr:hypothetical protein MTP99_015024 [Tenebrio molitor]